MVTEQVSEPTSLPPYPQMIFAAIDGLKQKEGSNKSSISNFMESTYGDLSADHITLLTEHLNKLKETGELVFVRNSYMRPDPHAPLKRGRGRPRKPKVVVQGESGSEVKRGRGRPKKDPNTPSVPKLTEHLNKLKESGYMRPGPHAPLTRARGPPPKAEVVVKGKSGSEVKRVRGRPKKDPNTPSVPKKVSGGSGRGSRRHRKVQPELAGGKCGYCGLTLGYLSDNGMR